MKLLQAMEALDQGKARLVDPRSFTGPQPDRTVSPQVDLDYRRQFELG